MVREKDFYYKKDRLNQLRGFCATVQNGSSIANAARATGLEAATISRQISALERDIKIPLFDRSKLKRLRLTEEGRVFYEDAVLKLQGIDSLFIDYSKVIAEKNKNYLRIASLGEALEKMWPFILEFKEQNPNVEFGLLNISKDEAFQRLINRRAELAFYSTGTNEKAPVELNKTKISNFTSFWTMHPNHPLAKKDEKDITRKEIASYPFGVFKEGVFTMAFKQFIDEFNLKDPIYTEYGTMTLLKEMIKDGVCISLMNDIYFNSEEKKDFVFKSAKWTMPERNIYCFNLKNTANNNLINDFLKLIKKNEDKIFH
ncbi:MAG: LysR family transcriptional regulator [Rickettsiales bacterium]|nr:LysR family transcriptional regulator [Rickettsiales bacterium]